MVSLTFCAGVSVLFLVCIKCDLHQASCAWQKGGELKLIHFYFWYPEKPSDYYRYYMIHIYEALINTEMLNSGWTMSLQRGLVSFPTILTHAIGSNLFSLSPSLFSPLPCVISAYSLRHNLWVLLCVNLLREPTCLIKGFYLSLRTTLHFCSVTHTHKPTHTHVINLASGIVRMRSVALCVLCDQSVHSLFLLSLAKKRRLCLPRLCTSEPRTSSAWAC